MSEINQINQIDQIPAEPHYAVFADQLVTVEGGHQVALLSYIPFADEDALKAWISVNSHLPFKVVNMKPITVKTQVELS